MNVKAVEHKMVVRSLMKNESYLQLKTIKERIEFVLKVVDITSLRKSVHQIVKAYTEFHKKDLAHSIAFKDEAINYFLDGQYEKAVHFFTFAIISSPLNSNDSVMHLSQSFSLKSLAQFHLKDFSGALMSANHSLKLCETTEMQLQRVLCLKHFERFEESLQYLNQMIERYGKQIKLCDNSIKDLNEIRKDIKEKMSNNGIESDLREIEISLLNSMENFKEPISDGHIWVHPNCTLNVSEKKGRHVLANDFIPKGTTILMESPISIVIVNQRYTTCHYCYKTGLSSVWPCIGCDEVVYCNEDCSMKAYEYHHMFCGFVELFESLGLSLEHTFKMLSKLGVEKAIDFHQKKKSFDFTEFFEKNREIEENSENQMETTLDFESLFLAFYSLAENYSTEDVVHIYDILISIEVVLLLEWKQQICFDEQEIERFITLVEIIFKCSNKVWTNGFGWSYLDEEQQKREYLGSCVMNFGSLFNHSCDPNVFWDFVGTKLMITTVTDITSGQELCANYGPTFLEPFDLRQKKLRIVYFFNCDCKACLRDIKSVLCLRCEHCTGPVPFIDMSRIIKRDICCLKCGKKFEEAKKTMDIINSIVEQLLYSLDNILNEVNIKESFQLATVLLQRLSRWAYPQSLGICLKQLINICLRYHFFFESVKWLEWFVNEFHLNYDDIQSVDSISIDVLEELTVWTNCYYGLFLNERTAMGGKQWSNCFYFYSKLIGFLQILLKEDRPMVRALRVGLFHQDIFSLLLEKEKEFLEIFK